MDAKIEGGKYTASELLKKRIAYLSDAAKKLAVTFPTVSHCLMREALGRLKDVNGALPKDHQLYICGKCGVPRTYCINTKIRCQASTPRQRRKCRKLYARQKAKDKGVKPSDGSIISHRNVMIYECKLCNGRIMLPGEASMLPSKKRNRK